MPPSQRVRPSPYDRFTDASPTAVTSGFSAAMALGPQPKLEKGDRSEGTDWLRNLQKAAGLNKEEFPLHDPTSGLASGIIGDDEDLSDEEDGDSEDESIAAGGKRKGRKSKSKMKGSKAPNDDSTAAQRKAQNRVAQREFRQRKQQYIRALEARVELLSSDHDTQVNRLRYALRGLLAENNQLRSLLGCMTAFIGTEMLGGPLQKAGMSRKELEAMILSTSEKTMTEIWEDWPGARECEALNQIRLESNLPKEGLPESHRYADYPSNARGSTDIALSKSHNGNESPVTKRKSTAEDNGNKNSKRRQHIVNEGTDSTSPHETIPTAATSEVQVQEPSASGFSILPQIAPSDQNASYNAFYSQTEAPQFNAEAGTGLPNLSANPMFSGLNMFSPPTSSGDSNAILASLFGADNMVGMFGQSSASTFGQYGSNLPYSDPSFDANGARQKTIANVEEPEEIRRISTFAVKLTSGEFSPGTAVDPSQLSFAVKGITQLVHQMATFRRQPSYHLPALLLPSDIQQTRPHDPLIDSLPFSGLRQRLIVLQDSLVMDDVLLSFLQHVKLHSEDATDAANWELDAGFFLENCQLVDRDTLAITNSWRSRREEKPLSYADLSTRAT